MQTSDDYFESGSAILRKCYEHRIGLVDSVRQRCQRGVICVDPIRTNPDMTHLDLATVKYLKLGVEIERSIMVTVGPLD